MAADEGDATLSSDLQTVLAQDGDAAQAFKRLVDAVGRGSTAAMATISYCYGHGIGVGANMNEAVRWPRQAVAIRPTHGPTLYVLGVAYAVFHKDAQEAAVWYKHAAECGSLVAMARLGDCYANGNGVVLDVSEAVRWFKKAADNGDAAGMAKLGHCYWQGIGVAKDKAQGRVWLRRAANAGNADGTASCYLYGIDGRVDKARALTFLRQAADEGDAASMKRIGLLYLEGDTKGGGPSLDVAQGLTWLKRAVDAGDTTAIVELGRVHGFGVDVPQNSAQAYALFLEAAEKGDMHAAFLVGGLMVFGVGVDKDVETGVAFLRTASDGGHRKAMWALANVYMRGIGVKQNTALAAHWFDKLAALGEYDAIRTLSRMADAAAPREDAQDGGGSGAGPGPKRRSGIAATPEVRVAATTEAMDVDAEPSHTATSPGQTARVGCAQRRLSAARRSSTAGAGNVTEAALARQLQLDTCKIDEYRTKFAATGVPWTDDYTQRRQALDGATTGNDLVERTASAKRLRETLRKALLRQHTKPGTAENAERK